MSCFSHTRAWLPVNQNYSPQPNHQPQFHRSQPKRQSSRSIAANPPLRRAVQGKLKLRDAKSRSPASQSQATGCHGTGTTSWTRGDEATATGLPPSPSKAAAAEDPAPKHPARLRRARRRTGASARLLPAPIALALFVFCFFLVGSVFSEWKKAKDERNCEEMTWKWRVCRVTLFIFPGC
jgi:hypothetical protein